MIEINPWMLDYVDERNGEIIRWCKPCSEKDGAKRFVVIRGNGKAIRDLEKFEKRHKWCGLDREFNIKLIQNQLERELSDKERVFIGECMNEGWEKDQILEHLRKNRHVTPSQSLMRLLG